MGVFTFVCRESGTAWSAKQLNGELEASADCTFTLQRKLVQAALSADSSGGVQSSFSYVTPSSAVFQVIIGGGGGAFVGGGGGGGGGASAPAASGGGAAAEAPPAEEKKEEKEESDDDMGFSLFD
ncbi:large ribosomal subunit protein P3z-like [Primulina huaijiensis]|uniref:large ribosomal subunit protein P3z-like n=1 Tax=Primulina huaijiensis TaxID=1492673 RepID=UPI003CC734FA